MAKLLGRGVITLICIDEGYQVLFSPQCITIPANYDGSSPDLSNAKTEIAVLQGGKPVNFTITNDEATDPEISCQYIRGQYNHTWTITIDQIPTTLISGSIRFYIKTQDSGYTAYADFNYSVVRSVQNVKWIQEWDGTATELAEDYVVTPKLFAGHKENDGSITGVFIGNKSSMPSDSGYPFEGNVFEGIYGYEKDKISFCIDKNGAFIGGWMIHPGYIVSMDKRLTIHSQGFIIAQENGVGNWALKADGSAYFAQNNVRFGPKGDAYFNGSIESKDGIIGGWTISKQSIYNGGMSLNSGKHFIAIANIDKATSAGENQLDLVRSKGGVAMYYTSSADYGFVAYTGTDIMFSAGSVNKISSWNFTSQSLYTGEENDTLRAYTTKGITLGNNGVRGTHWYIDSDGVASFAGDYIHFEQDGGIIAGWNFDEDSLFSGTKIDAVGAFTLKSGDITIGSNGIRGYKWRLESTGAGSVAGDKIKWDLYGNVSFDNSIKLMWETGISIAQMTAFGQILHRDPEFTLGFNDTLPYGVNAAIRQIMGDVSAPNSSKMIMRLVNRTWNALQDPRLCGFYFGDQSRPNAKFLVRIVAKIPEYWFIHNDHNPYGVGSTTEWLTPRIGTGKWEEYICVIKCGPTGSAEKPFGTINHFSLRYQDNKKYEALPPGQSLSIILRDKIVGQNVFVDQVVWDIAYITTIDATSSEKMTTTIDKDGIYTGTLTAEQVNALQCTFDKGTIGGWSILSKSIKKGNVCLDSEGSIVNGNFWKLANDGSGFLAGRSISWKSNGDAEFTGKITAGSGAIGGISLASDHIGILPKKKAENGDDSKQLSIYKDYFQVGGTKGCFMAGDSVLNDYETSHQTIVSKIINRTPNTTPWMGVDNINFGLDIHVSGAKKCYGVNSNSALRATGFIATKAKFVNLTPDTRSDFDFSQHNILLLSYTGPKDGFELILPTEREIAQQFGYVNSNLPNDFAVIFTLRVQTGSKQLWIPNIYDNRNVLNTYKLYPGDSIVLLVSKYGGFQYSCLNHYA